MTQGEGRKEGGTERTASTFGHLTGQAGSGLDGASWFTDNHSLAHTLSQTGSYGVRLHAARIVLSGPRLPSLGAGLA